MNKERNELKMPSTWHCKRCGNDWEGRILAKPKACPRCKNPFWDKDYVREPKNRIPWDNNIIKVLVRDTAAKPKKKKKTKKHKPDMLKKLKRAVRK